MKRVAVPAVLMALGACVGTSSHFTESQPAALVGQWVLLRQDGTWGDTVTWRPDGTMLGSTNHAVPADARWAERSGSDGAHAICIGGGGESNCQPYVLHADTLLWGQGTDADRFRRVAGPGVK